MSNPYPDPQSPYQQSPYQQPAFPAAQPPGGAPATMPPSVKRAQLLVYVWVGLAALSALVTLVAKNALVDAYLDSIGATGDYREIFRSGAPAYTAVALIWLVLFGGLMIFAALNYAKRANWARVVTYVFAGLAALGLVLQFLQPSPFWFKLIGIATGLVAVAIIVLLSQKDSNAWFAKRPAA